MGSCSPFTAVTGSAVVDLARHVNYTNGMVLGADDYTQEFAYHAARDQWISREALGCGTLCGLAVDVELDGTKGPRVRVSAGSAVAPSGQLIRVGRDQCGSLNGWLAESAIAAQVTALAAGLSPPTAIDLTLYLTLRYIDCAVAPVPIPGEPCRSAEELMQPSRIADDYLLNFSFTPPPMAELEAVPLLEGFIADIATAAPGAATLAELVARARLQLSLAFGANVPVANPADLGRISVEPAQRPALLRALRQLWVTRLRPLVTAQPSSAAEDGVLLAVLTVPVVNGGGGWEVKPGPTPTTTSVTIDESKRPLLLAGNAAFGGAATAFAAVTPSRSLAFLTATGASPFTRGLLLLHSASALTVTLDTPATANQGHLLEIRNLGTGAAQLSASGSTRIGGADPPFALAPRGRVTLRSNGTTDWQVMARMEGRVS